MDSPFLGVLHTNAVPTDAERDRIRDFLQRPREELTVLTQEIGRLQSLPLARRDELEDLISAHLAMVSLVYRLPDDILREIFLPTLPSTGRNPALSANETPSSYAGYAEPGETLPSQRPVYGRRSTLSSPALRDCGNLRKSSPPG